MKLNVPAGVSQVFADDGTVVSVVGGQCDVEPHLVNELLAQGFTVAGADALVSDAADPMTDPTVTE